MPSCQDSIGRQKKPPPAEENHAKPNVAAHTPLQWVFGRECERMFRAHLEQRAPLRVIRKGR